MLADFSLFYIRCLLCYPCSSLTVCHVGLCFCDLAFCVCENFVLGGFAQCISRIIFKSQGVETLKYSRAALIGLMSGASCPLRAANCSWAHDEEALEQSTETLISSFKCPPQAENMDSSSALGWGKAKLRLVRLEHLANSYHKPSCWCRKGNEHLLHFSKNDVAQLNQISFHLQQT